MQFLKVLEKYKRKQASYEEVCEAVRDHVKDFPESRDLKAMDYLIRKFSGEKIGIVIGETPRGELVLTMPDYQSLL